MDEDIWRPRLERNQVKGHIYGSLRNRPNIKCLYPIPGGCPERVIGSHSVQKSSILRTLADPSHHVIMFEARLELEEPPMGNPPKPKPTLIGINEATVFNGLCAAHDDLVFKPIESQPFEPGRVEHIFLAAYRAVLAELFRKRVTRAQMEAIAERTTNDEGTHLLAKMMTAFAARAHAEGEEWLAALKDRFDQDYLAKRFDAHLDHWSTVVQFQASFALSSCFTPIFDFSGTRVQVMEMGKAPDWIAFSILPYDGATVVTMTTPKNSPADIKAMCSTIQAARGEKFELLVSELALANIENIAIAPRFWNALSGDRQQVITDFFAATVLGQHAAFPGPAANLFHL